LKAALMRRMRSLPAMKKLAISATSTNPRTA
jgi:hypothetical protein